MNSKKIILILICLILISSFSFALDLFCARAHISRLCSPNFEFSDSAQEGDNLIVPNNATLTVDDFGVFEYPGPLGLLSWDANNYVYIYDNKANKIIATNGVNQIGGPNAVSGLNMCVTVDDEKKFCYAENCLWDQFFCDYFPPLIFGLDTCLAGKYAFGSGKKDSIELQMTNYFGEQDWSVMLGEISPGGVEPDSPLIISREVERLKFYVDASQPAILVFPPNPLQKINSFQEEGTTVKDLYFTLLNKSRVSSTIIDYNVACPLGVSCTLDTVQGGTDKLYKGFTLSSNQAMMIHVTYSFNKNKFPLKFDSILTLTYTPNGYSGCPNGKCTATSTPVTFELGLLDKQDFQINVLNEIEAKYCVDYEGHLGKTGSDYAPRINLYFGGNISPLVNPDSSLVSMNECSPLDYATMQSNPNWVYCTQNEFLVQLAARIGLYAKNMTDIDALESNANFAASSIIRQANGQIGTFTAYLREQDLSKASRNSSVLEMTSALSDVPFTKLGYISGEVTNTNQFKKLIDKVTLINTVGGITVDNTKFSPGEYRITIDVNKMQGQNLGGLFLANDEFNPKMNVIVYIEKISEPKLNWFFYYTRDNYKAELYSPTLAEGSYTTNYLDRGTIMNFEKTSTSSRMINFYPTISVPLIAKLVDKGQAGVSDSSFKVDGAYYTNKSAFSVWTGFASSLGGGCQTTIVNPKEGDNALPYRLIDSSLSDNWYTIEDLNELQPNTKLYVSTVLYLPSMGALQMQVPFKAFTLKQTVTGTNATPAILVIDPNDYSQYTIDSLTDVLDGMKNEKVCIYYDKSAGAEKWKLFWNQDKVLDALKSTVSSQITSDGVTICPSRALMSS